MDVRTCKKCGRLFNYIGSGEEVCAFCKSREDDAFKKVKDYLYEHRGAGFYEVRENYDVDAELLRKWLREGRLEFAKGADSGLTCERCGAPIPSGRYCEKCKNEMANDLREVYPDQANAIAEKNMKARQDERERMRFLKSRQ